LNPWIQVVAFWHTLSLVCHCTYDVPLLMRPPVSCCLFVNEIEAYIDPAIQSMRAQNQHRVGTASNCSLAKQLPGESSTARFLASVTSQSTCVWLASRGWPGRVISLARRRPGTRDWGRVV
jgi:hypothetical protein